MDTTNRPTRRTLASYRALSTLALDHLGLLPTQRAWLLEHVELAAQPLYDLIVALPSIDARTAALAPVGGAA